MKISKKELKALHDSRMQFVEYCRAVETQDKELLLEAINNLLKGKTVLVYLGDWIPIQHFTIEQLECIKPNFKVVES